MRKNKRTQGVQRVPTVLQLEAVECGAACLAMILAHHGRYETLEKLRSLCGVSRDGAKASSLLKVARSFGFEAKGYRKEPEELIDLPMPAVVFWNFNHYIVLEGIRGQFAYVNDPAHGRRKMSLAEFEEGFTGVVLTFQEGPSFTRGGQRSSVLRGLHNRTKGLGLSILFLVLVGCLLVIPGLVMPVFSSVFVDNILVDGLQGWLRPLLLGLGLTAVLRLLLTWLQNYYLLRIETHLSIVQSAKYLWHVLRLPIDFFLHRSAGDIQSRLAINQTIASVLTTDIAQALLGIISIVMFGALMLAYDVELTLISIASAVVMMLVIQSIARQTADTNRALSVDGGKLSGVSIAGLSAIESIKASGSEQSFLERWAGHQARFLNAQQDVARVGLVFGTIPPLVVSLTSAAILVFGGLKVMEGDLTLGELVAFQSLSVSFIAPVRHFVEFANRIHALKGDMERLDDVMRNEVAPSFRDEETEDEKPFHEFSGLVELRNIKFGYNKSGVALIDGFEADVEAGSRVAIVGTSGCGKSTVSKLLVGLYDPWEGEILFDGRPRLDFNRHQFAKNVALVDQDIHLFQGTFRDNLKMWDSSISDEDMIAAARDACIHDVILEHKGGYDGLVCEGGTNMSGGQRQRLEIARALTQNPVVLILDEATSALDSKTRAGDRQQPATPRLHHYLNRAPSFHHSRCGRNHCSGLRDHRRTRVGMMT